MQIKSNIGDKYEFKIAHRYNSFGHVGKNGEVIPLFPHVLTTRDINQELDHIYKVDISTENPQDLQKFGLLIQAKDRSSNPPYPKLLAALVKGVKRFKAIPVVYHRQARKELNTSKATIKRGEYAILNASDFEDIWTKLNTYKAACKEMIPLIQDEVLKNELADKYNL